ncbi:undecaprenyl-diphosphatase [Geothrix limicola]|uniref:Undecaprenyl-diphosphatase n=1 Tax=Geothrix limicola TaxID=2927978 RepID=A0ABQ5QBV0_9BACT|nr:undecaprenyl-diphosphate phosphatase [Geothrix limicola]GLH71940.1 undecaprenyl-diphosphatase [Geothrix limicola]
MNLLHAILLGLIQGLTEFLPVSSTAHLTLAEHLMFGGRAMPLAFDVLLHVGTLVALAIYFRHELVQVLMGCFGRDKEGRRLAIWLFVAMIPTGIFGMATRGVKEAAKEHLWVYGVGLLCTAVLLFIANHLSKERASLNEQDLAGRDIQDLRAMDALAVGTIQGIGGGFGLSRSGSTISVGVFRGLKLPASARFSFLLGMPTIAAAAVVELRGLLKPLMKHLPLPPDMAFPAGSASPVMLCVVGVIASAISGYLAIGLLDRFTRKPRLNGFALYCLGMGAVMLALGLSGVLGHH